MPAASSPATREAQLHTLSSLRKTTLWSGAHDLIRVSYTPNAEIQMIEMPWWSDLHVHQREGALARSIARPQLRGLKYALLMPNLIIPIDTVEGVVRYHRLMVNLARSYGLPVDFVMTIYLTRRVTPAVIAELAKLPFKVAVKYYPPHKGATTGSGFGVHLHEATETLRAMEKHKIPLLIHGETVYDAHGHEIELERREDYFMEHEFDRLREAHPDLYIVIEHATTAAAVAKVKRDKSGKTRASFTPQGLLFVNKDLHLRTWGKYLKCMPIAKTFEDRSECLDFATSGDWRAHAGSDTAAHISRKKEVSFAEAACGCYLPHALSLYALAFKMKGMLNGNFVRFACFNGPAFWGLPFPAPTERLRLIRDVTNDIPEPTPVEPEGDVVVPLGWTKKHDRLRVDIALDEESFLRAA